MGEVTSLATRHYHSLGLLLQRLKATIEHETALLGQRDLRGIAYVVEKKNQLLLELSQLERVMHAGLTEPPVEIKTQAGELRQALSDNSKAVSQHMEAARELTDYIANAMRQDQSDGTYSYGEYTA